MILVDDHCHLTHELYKDQLDAVLDRARKAGVKGIVCSGVNVPTNREVLELARKYGPLVKCSFGIYPTDAIGEGADEAGLAKQKGPIDIDSELQFIKEHKDEISAIGEVGLDFHWIKDEAKHKLMKENFEKIISFAEKIKKPLVIHSRKAEKECLDILESSNVVNVVQHCFSGKKKLVRRAVDLGHYISIPAAVTHVPQFQMNAELVPLNQIITETDGPWMSPVKGTPSEPAFVKYGVEKISAIKGFEAEEVANAIWVNFQKVFG